MKTVMLAVLAILALVAGSVGKFSPTNVDVASAAVGDVIAWDDFESGNLVGGGGWLGLGGWEGNCIDATPLEAPHAGSYQARIHSGCGANTIRRGIDLSGKSSLRLEFWARADIGTNGWVRCTISPDGITWWAVKTWVTTVDTYQYVDIDLSPYNNFMTSTFWMSFNFSSSNNCTLWVDDLKVVQGEPQPPPPIDPTIIAWDDFESGNLVGGGGWLGLGGWEGNCIDATPLEAPHAGSYQARIHSGCGANTIRRGIDLSGKSSLRLEFWARADIGTNGWVRCNISPDGITWWAVKTWVTTVDTYQYVEIDLSPYNNFMTSTFWMSFNFSSSNNCTLWVDDLKVVQGEPQPPPPIDPTIIAWDNFESGNLVGGGGWLGLGGWEGNCIDATPLEAPHSGSYQARIHSGCGANTIRRGINLSGKSSLRLEFWARADIGTNGWVRCNISPDGTTWSAVKTWVTTVDTYQYVDIDLSPYNNFMTSTFWMSFNFSSSNNCTLWVDDLMVTSNHRPDSPNNKSPSDSATAVSLTPSLEAWQFSDPDSADSHVASQWQVRAINGSYSSPIWDSGVTTSNLVSITVPSYKLAYNSTYYWHTKHQDDHVAWSEWSEETSFTTQVTGNQAPSAPTGLGQFKSDGSTALVTGGATTGNSVVFKATIADPDGDQVKLQVELRRLDEYGGQFDYTKGGLKESTLVSGGSMAVANASELIEAGYHWRARTVDEHGGYSQWVEFGSNDTSQADFAVEASGNQSPYAPTGLGQFKSDGSTALATGGAITENSVVFKATIADPDGDQVKLQVELRRLNEYGGQFDYTKGGLKESTLVGSGSMAVANASELIEAGYHWRARTVDEHGGYSQWVEFGNNDTSQVDFTVSTVPAMKKTVKILTRPYVPTGEMTVTYLPAGEMSGQDTYKVSQIDIKCIGFSGVCLPYIRDSTTGVAWSDVLVVGPGAPYLKTYVAGSTPNFPSNITVTASGTFSITMRGVDVIGAMITAEKAAADVILTKVPGLGAILDLLGIDMETILEEVNADPWKYPWYFSKASSVQFSPDSAQGESSEVDAPDVNVAYLCSPGELRVYDSTDRVAGLVDGMAKAEIPDSFYDCGSVLLQGASSVDSYRYEVAGKEEGSYGLIVAQITDEGATTFSSADLPILLGTVHTYTIDSDALARGEKGVTLEIDSNGDGKPEDTLTADTELNRDEFDSATKEGGLPFWIWIIVGVGAVAIMGVVGVSVWRHLAKKPVATG